MKRWIGLAAACAAWTALPAAAQQAPAASADYQVGERLAPAKKGGAAQFRDISWDDLIPADWKPEELFKDFDFAELTDNDPRALELMKKLREEWDRAPVVQALNGQRVRIPGFVVPLDNEGGAIRDFLLVPYFGACIHTPPPPANQLIHVQPDKPVPGKWNMAPVWVSGELAVERYDSDLGNAGYRLRGVRVEEFKETRPRK